MKTVDIIIEDQNNSEEPFKKNELPEKIREMNITISEYDTEVVSLESEEDLTEKTITYIEKEVRGSFEYKKYLNYLKTELDLTKCALLPGIDCSEGAASLEFHHFPMNLYEITETVGKKLINNLHDDEKISCFEITEKVMEEHFRGNIGLVPLTVSLHKMAHNRSIIVPISKVNGNYENFVKKYSDVISEDIKDRIQEAKLNSESDDSKLYNELKLEKNIANYNIKYLNSENDNIGGFFDEDEEDF